MNDRSSDSNWKYRRDDDWPDYGLDHSLLDSADHGLFTRGPHATRQFRQASRYWCNVCNEFCESDEALREHYRATHPAIAAEIEAKMAGDSDPENRLGGLTSSREGSDET